MTGTTIGHYEIQEKLGEGGMGMVFKARDLLLNRPAALKFLPPESCATEDKRRRFIQEAQSASALNHPNIITIYEIAQSENRDFIAMELIKGRTLDQVVGRKGLSLNEALPYAIQIADALAAAHGAGIVHRDLKPGNIMVCDTGLVKVLDFGLAKLMPGSDSSEWAVTRTILANESPKTAEGSIVGTVSYMSPEQAEGKQVDHRSDIFAFGAVLYEMLTGRKAFRGESAVSTLAAILTAEPVPLSREAGGIPDELTRIVNRCLRKAPEKRWQSMADVRIALEEFKQELDSGQLAGPSVAHTTPRRRWIQLAGAALLAAALTGFIAWRLRPAAGSPDHWRIRRLTSDSGASLLPAISPDGKFVAYSSDRSDGQSVDIWVQQVEGGDSVRLTHDLGSCRDAAFSPDGAKIVFNCGSEPASIYIVSTLGGLPRRIGEGDHPQFSADGTQIAYAVAYAGIGPGGSDANRSIWIMPAGGGAPREVATKKRMVGSPLWAPDGKGFLFVSVGGQQNAPDDDWFFLSEDGKTLAATGAWGRLRNTGLWPGRNLSATPGGILFVAGDLDSTNIYRLPFDSGSHKVSGDAIPVIAGAGYNFSPSASSDGQRIAFAVGNNLTTNIWRVPIDAAAGKTSGQPIRVTEGLDAHFSPSPSRDARRVVYTMRSSKAAEIRIQEVASGKELRLADAKEWSSPVLSEDGTQVAYRSDQREKSPLYVVPATGGVARKICQSCGRPIEWIANGTKILYDNGGQGLDIGILDVASRQNKILLHHPKQGLYMPRLSPDGRLMCFTMQLPGRARRIYVAPFSGEPIAEKDWTLLVDGTELERQPFWSPAGNLIYFLSDRDGTRCVWAQRVNPATRGPSGAPFAVHHIHQVRYNLTDVGDPALVGLSVANGQMFYASFELQSNIWMAQKQQAAAK
jgi:serine/threonine protein kinase